MSILEKIELKNIEDEIENAEKLFKIHKKFMRTVNVRWIFRGQKKEEGNNPLKTSLEKALESFKISLKECPAIEEGFVRKFKRHSAIYLNNIPDLYSYMEWFALMQHYGAPTRLQDWTYSFFAATYMAINDMEKDAEVWAINTNYIEGQAKNIIGEEDKFKAIRKHLEDDDIKTDDVVKNDACAHIPGLFEEIFMSKPLKLFVLPMNPHNLNERLIIQQGIFLCPGDITKSFYKNLSACFKDEADLNKNNICRFKINDDINLKKNILMHLHRMNMNNATLFPGLSGFSKSLKTLLAFYEKQRGMLTGDSEYVKKYLYRLSRKNRCNYKVKKIANKPKTTRTHFS